MVLCARVLTRNNGLTAAGKTSACCQISHIDQGFIAERSSTSFVINVGDFITGINGRNVSGMEPAEVEALVKAASLPMTLSLVREEPNIRSDYRAGEYR